MSAILPDTPGVLSGWGTENHYFYEIRNWGQRWYHIAFVINYENLTEELMTTIDQIEQWYKPKRKVECKRYTYFRTQDVDLGDPYTKESVYTGLARCLEEIQNYEADLRQKLKR